ncbi:hypothetical protein AA313_de0208912 [Arthrobotrys entomopaga]|nr:hypothetical protein AA313_de0208912 [Arthrobotrys entomopaga]
MAAFKRYGQVSEPEYRESEATASTSPSYKPAMPTPPTSPAFSRKPAPTHETPSLERERSTDAESDFRRRRADFYHNAIPLATRNGDLEAVETAYSRLIRLAEIQPSTVTSTLDDGADKVSTLHLSLASKRQALGKWQTALDALDCVNEEFLAGHKEHAVSYWHVKALVYLGLEQIDSAEEAAMRALDIARDIAEKAGERGRNTGYFIMAIIMAMKEDRMEAAFFKSLVKESGDLDTGILERQWQAFDAINGDFGVRVLSKRGLGGQEDDDDEVEDDLRSSKRAPKVRATNGKSPNLNSPSSTARLNKFEMRQVLKTVTEIYTPTRGFVVLCCWLFLLIISPTIAFTSLFGSIILLGLVVSASAGMGALTPRTK